MTANVPFKKKESLGFAKKRNGHRSEKNDETRIPARQIKKRKRNWKKKKKPISTNLNKHAKYIS